MSDHVVKTYHASDDGGGSSNHSYQSVWMAHWMPRSSSAAAPPAMDYLSHPFRKKEDGLEIEQQDLESGMEIHSFSEGFKKLGDQISEIMNGSPTNGENFKNSFPMFPHGSNSESKSLLKNDQGIVLCQASRPQTDLSFKNGSTALLVVAPPPTESSSKKQLVQSENNPSREVKSDMFFRDKYFADPGPLQDDFTGSMSHIVPHGSEHGENKLDGVRTTGPSFFHDQEESMPFSPIVESKVHLSNTNLAKMKHEHRTYGCHSASFIYEKKMDIHTGRSPLLDLELKNRSPLSSDLSRSDNISPMFVGEQYQWMQNCSSLKLFQRQVCPPKMTNLEKLDNGSHSIQKIPHFVDVETMRICSIPNSRSTGCPPKFSQTIHSLLVTKDTDLNMCKENEILRESRVSTNFKGTTFDKLHSFSPYLVRASQGSGLHPLEIMKDNGGNENVKADGAPGLNLKNESSAEIDAMDTNAFSKNEFGTNSSSSNKDTTENPDIQFQSSNASDGRKVECGEPISEIPDINLELPALPAPVSSMDEAERSRTESLDMEQLCSHAEQPSISNFNHQSDCPEGQEPTSRWIKRFKLTASNSFGLGTKISNMADSSHDKVNNLLSKTATANISGSEEAFSGPRGKELMAPDRTAGSLRIGESSSVDTTKGRDIVLSHPWIQRWCHKVTYSQKNPETLVICEPQCSKLELEDLQKQQFPSIAAMALMGKAMRGFKPSEFQDRGSFVVWNIKGF